jgi:exo-beta-1,3-glucanase (GH17 family)
VINPRAAALAAPLALLLLLPAPQVAATPPVCGRNPAVLPAMTRLRSALAQGRFVAYEPTSLKVSDGHITPADPESIRSDLTVLRPKFDALITYSAIHGAESVAAVAAALKFRALIVGVWDPADNAELAAAVTAARRYPQLVLGLSLGNERLFSHRTDAASLAALLARVRAQLPATALATTEPFHIYHQPEVAPLLRQLDFLLVNAHPVFQPWFHESTDATAAQFVVNVLAGLAPLACGPILVKETGIPTAPGSAGFSAARQASFYRELRARLTSNADRAFAYFAAFDAPWRAYDAIAVPGAAPGVHPEEAHWGLYDAERRPKQAARELSALQPTAAR